MKENVSGCFLNTVYSALYNTASCS